MWDSARVAVRSTGPSPRVPRPQGHDIRPGLWAVSYASWIPTLVILPPPHTDIPGRAWTILTAHVVYGGAVGGALARYDDVNRMCAVTGRWAVVAPDSSSGTAGA
jgi:hypothetical protein